MDLIQAIVYGLLQGLTEFLPISSSAHIRIAPALLGWPDPGAAFTAAIQLGTVLAVLIYFRKDLADVFSGWLKSLKKGSPSTMESKVGWGIVFGTVPIVVLGFAFKDVIETQLRSLQVVAGGLIVMALLLALSEKVGSRKRSLETVTPRDGVVVGLWQALALIPGCSRSGSTITGALFAGFDRATAARYSFLLSVPAILLSGLYSLYSHRKEFGSLMMPLMVSNIVSFAVGYACIAFLMSYLQKRSTMVFIVYRLVLGVLILVLIQSGRLDAFAGVH